MNYGIIYPPKNLSNYVRSFWFVEGNQPYVHKAFAYLCPEIVFCYKGYYKYGLGLNEDKTLRSAIFGQTETFSQVALSMSDFGILGVYLYPHAIPQLFGLPANEITNQHLDMRTLCGREGEILEEKMMLASDIDERLKLLCNFLTRRLKNIKPEFEGLCSSIRRISSLYTASSVSSLAESHYLSLRQFERKFKEYSGFRPSLFLRIARFNALLSAPFQHTQLADIAYQFGYYDQAHFSHDFKKFSNQNPKEFFKEQIIRASDRGTVELET
jgi:AraC-like DNA-binding protein